MAIKLVEIAALVMLALINDIKSCKIKNSITFPFIFIGLATNFFLDGLKGVTQSLLAAVFPVAALIILYALRMLGAGDIKLFSAIGAVMGLDFVLYTMAYSFISGGIIALALIAVRKNGRQRLLHLLSYIRSCFLTFSLQPYENFEDKTRGGTFRFSYAVGCGTLVCFAALYIIG